MGGTSTSEYYDYEQYLKGMKTRNQAYPANLSLQVLSVQTGGRVFNQSNDLPSEIAAEIARGAADAGVFYVLSFASEPSDRIE